MSAATKTLENQLLSLLFTNTAFSGIGEGSGLPGAASAGSFYISLHGADPGENGTQGSSETGYPGYTRIAVARSAGGWTITGNTFKNTAAVQFPASTGGSHSVTHVGIGTAPTGAGKLLWRAAFSNPSSLTVSTGIAPKFDAGTITGEVN